MLVQVRIVGNLPHMVKGLQKQYVDLPFPDGARVSDLLNFLQIKRELFVFSDGKRLEINAPLSDGMEITIFSPAAGG